MKRLTYFDGGKWRLKIGDTEYSGAWVDRLAAYEDTGLEPEEITAIIGLASENCAKTADKIDQLLSDDKELGEYRALGPIDRLRELAEADREGRCVVYPCVPGQVVWAANSFGVSSHQIRRLVRDKDGDFACSMIKFPLNDFGREVFLTRKEAEAALRREQDG